MEKLLFYLITKMNKRICFLIIYIIYTRTVYRAIIDVLMCHKNLDKLIGHFIMEKEQMLYVCKKIMNKPISNLYP